MDKTAALNIVHYLPSIRLADGGIVRSVLDWCAIFAQRGHRMTLLTRQGQDVPQSWFSGGCALPRVLVLSKGTPLIKPLNGAAIEQARQILASADILHLHAPWHPGNRQLAKLAMRMNVPYVVTLHGMLDDWAMSQRSLKKRAYMRLFGRRFLDGAALIHCTAQAELSQARKWFSNPRVLVLPCLIDLQPFHELPGPRAGLELIPEVKRQLPKVLFLSRLHEKKGVDTLIRAAGIVRDKGLHLLLMVAGEGDADYVRSLQVLVAQLQLSDRVQFMGLITGRTKLSLFEAADLFALPTKQENFGIVLVEALACGTPVVTTRGTDIWQELQGAGGIICDDSPDAFATAIVDALPNKETLASRGQRGRDWALKSLAIEPMYQKYLQAYLNIPSERS